MSRRSIWAVIDPLMAPEPWVEPKSIEWIAFRVTEPPKVQVQLKHFHCSPIEVVTRQELGCLGLSFSSLVHTTKKINNSLRKANSSMNGRIHLALGAKWSTGYQGEKHVHHQYPNTG